MINFFITWVYQLYHMTFKNILIKYLQKYGFCYKSFQKDEPLTSWTLFQHICPHFWVGLLLYPANPPISEDKYVEKVFNWSEVHLSEMTCYKIHTLGRLQSMLNFGCLFNFDWNPTASFEIKRKIYFSFINANRMEKKVHLNFSFINSRAFLIVFGFIFQISDFDGKINLICALHNKSFGIFESKYKAVFFFNHVFMAFNHWANLIIISMNNFTIGVL